LKFHQQSSINPAKSNDQNFPENLEEKSSSFFMHISLSFYLKLRLILTSFLNFFFIFIRICSCEISHDSAFPVFFLQTAHKFPELQEL
jgi:hypothetical protein